jgi:hypothetical protein
VTHAARLRALAAYARDVATAERVGECHALLDRRPALAAARHVFAAACDAVATLADDAADRRDPPPPPRAQAVPRPTQMN